ncbi:hypothetical protein CVD28_10110 [Bacillus sp. M6-12]|nr:hypothetical protein CVD28_10110 [Bacillus sp. M6-12]
MSPQDEGWNTNLVTTLATLAVLPLTRALSLLFIGVEGARLLGNAPHFLRAVFVQGSQFNVQREKRIKGDPRSV